MSVTTDSGECEAEQADTRHLVVVQPVVDDDPDIRNLLAAELRYRGYVVVVAHNGREALDCLDVLTPEVIVLDLMMPVMDGWLFLSVVEIKTATDPFRLLRCPRRATYAQGTRAWA